MKEFNILLNLIRLKSSFKKEPEKLEDFLILIEGDVKKTRELILLKISKYKQREYFLSLLEYIEDGKTNKLLLSTDEKVIKPRINQTPLLKKPNSNSMPLSPKSNSMMPLLPKN